MFNLLDIIGKKLYNTGTNIFLFFTQNKHDRHVSKNCLSDNDDRNVGVPSFQSRIADKWFLILSKTNMKKNTIPAIGLFTFISLVIFLALTYTSEEKARAKMYESVAELGDKEEELITELRCIQCKKFHEKAEHCVKYNQPELCDEAIASMDYIINTYYGEIESLCYQKCLDRKYPFLSMDN